VGNTDTACFYALLGELDHQLGGPRRLRNCTADSGWPLNGATCPSAPGEFSHQTLQGADHHIGVTAAHLDGH
jgi:hypothetical protein